LLIVEIQDSGVGIPATAMQRIFEPFEQAHRTLQNGVGGIGLGLTISKAIVEVHHGAILVESGGPNRGAIFTLQLLTKREPEPEPAPAPAVAEPTEAPPTAAPVRRILLVEDHVMTARNLQRLIQTEGYEVAIARDIASAKRMLQTRRFDILIADLGLPDGDGTELMHYLKTIGSSIPGVVLSGFGMEADIQRTREAGFQAHLVKPVTAEQLMEVVSRVLAEEPS
jgi:CheY-like chemotaxis protein